MIWMAAAALASSVINGIVSANNAKKQSETANKQIELQKKQMEQDQANIDKANAKQEQSEKNASSASSAFNLDKDFTQTASQENSLNGGLSGGLSGGLGSNETAENNSNSLDIGKLQMERI